MQFHFTRRGSRSSTVQPPDSEYLGHQVYRGRRDNAPPTFGWVPDGDRCAVPGSASAGGRSRAGSDIDVNDVLYVNRLTA